jgi:hypothetical protein
MAHDIIEEGSLGGRPSGSKGRGLEALKVGVGQ